MELPAITPNLLADNAPLQRLVNRQSLSPESKLHEAARQFEALFVRQMLKQMREPLVRSDLMPNSVSHSIYQDIVTGQLADSISRSGALGLARQLEAQLGKMVGATPAQNPDCQTNCPQDDSPTT